MSRILSIDPSLVCSGYAYTQDSMKTVVTGTIPTKKMTGLARLAYIRGRVSDLIDEVQPELVVYEGYAFGARGNNMFNIGELGGVLKMLVYQCSISVMVVPPSSLKMFITGHGGADKDLVMKCCGELAGRIFLSHDEADAYGLLRMGLLILEPRKRNRNKLNQENRALQGCNLE